MIWIKTFCFSVEKKESFEVNAYYVKRGVTKYFYSISKYVSRELICLERKVKCFNYAISTKLSTHIFLSNIAGYSTSVRNTWLSIILHCHIRFHLIKLFLSERWMIQICKKFLWWSLLLPHISNHLFKAHSFLISLIMAIYFCPSKFTILLWWWFCWVFWTIKSYLDKRSRATNVWASKWCVISW